LARMQYEQSQTIPFYNPLTRKIIPYNLKKGGAIPAPTEAENRYIFEQEAPPRTDLNIQAKAMGAIDQAMAYDTSGFGAFGKHALRGILGMLGGFSSIEQSNARAAERSGLWKKYKYRTWGVLQPGILGQAAASDTEPAEFLIQNGIR